MEQPILGHITEVHGPVVEIECLTLPPIRQALMAEDDDGEFIFEVYQHLDESNVRAIALTEQVALNVEWKFEIRAPLFIFLFRKLPWAPVGCIRTPARWRNPSKDYFVSKHSCAAAGSSQFYCK